MPERRTLAVALFLLGTFIGATVPSLAAQEPVPITSHVACAECVITVDTVLTLGGLEGEGMEAIDIISAIAVDARGRIPITKALLPRIYIFDMTGGFLRTVGRQGEGPGEYRWVSHIDAGPRHIHVFEFDNGRTLLDHDFEFVRRDRFPGQVIQAFVTDSEAVAFATRVSSPAASGHRLHPLAPSGEMESFGDGDSWYRTRESAGGIVTGDGTSPWSMEWKSTRVTRWDLPPKPVPAGIWDRTVDEWDRHDPSPNDPTDRYPATPVPCLTRTGSGSFGASPTPAGQGVVPMRTGRVPIPCRMPPTITPSGS